MGLSGNTSHLTSRGSRWTGTVAVLGAGLILGAFLSRVLAETPWVTWPFYRWGPTCALALIVGIALTFAWRAITRQSESGFESVAPLLPFYLLLFYLLQPAPNLIQAGVLFAGASALALLLSLQQSQVHPQGERLIGLLLFLIPLASYLSTLTPAVGTRDGYELQAISATLGFAHPTGYPLFPILGRLWIAVFPFGSIAWRINVLCALFAALSVPLVYGTARRVLGQRSVAALSALLFAFSHTLWTQASRPEKYTLNALFVSLILYIAFGAVDPETRGPHPHLRWLALVYSLSLTHHRTMLMLAPALAVYVLWRDPGFLKRPKEWVSTLGIALAPLSIYLYIPWRAAAQGWYMTPSEFIQYIAGSYYGPAVRLMDWLNPERSQMFWRFLVAQFGYVGIGLGVCGLIGLGFARRWRFLACTALAYFTYYVWGTMWYAYYNDVNSFIPNHVVFAIWIGSGAMAIWRVLLSVRIHAYVKPVFWSLLALLPMWMIWNNAPLVDASDEWNLTRWGEYAISQDIAPSATILADRARYPPLDYFARIERRRPDIDVVILGDEKAYLDRLVWDLAHEKTVYLARFLPGLEGPYHLRSLGPLVEVDTAPLALAGFPVTWSTDFDGYIQLLHHDVEEQDRFRPGDVLHVTLFWKAISPVPGNYQVNLRLISAGDQVWWAASDHPVNGMYPTAAWKAGEIVPDWHEIPIAETIPPGEYVLEVGLFPPFSSEGLPFAEGQMWLPLHKIQVAPGDTKPKIPHRLRAVRPGQWQLLGYDLPRQAPPTGRVPLTLYWQALTPLSDLEIGTRVTVPAGEGEWTWAVPGQGEYPASSWLPRQTAVTTHMLAMPAEEGKVTVQIAVRPAPTPAGVKEEELTFYPRWLAPRTSVLSFPPITVSGSPPAAPGTANFDDRILLLDADLRAKSLSPGAPLELLVRWQCIRAMEADYTLFVQVLDPDGTLKGQIDVWPKDGTHPTSQWREGEVIEDSYLLYVAEDAPPGNYQVAIGWYLLETMQRLPVLDAEGEAADDRVLLPGLTIVK